MYRYTIVVRNPPYHQCLSWCLTGWSWQFFNYEYIFKGMFFFYMSTGRRRKQRRRGKRKKSTNRRREKRYRRFTVSLSDLCVACVYVCLGACMKVHKTCGFFFIMFMQGGIVFCNISDIIIVPLVYACVCVCLGACIKVHLSGVFFVVIMSMQGGKVFCNILTVFILLHSRSIAHTYAHGHITPHCKHTSPLRSADVTVTSPYCRCSRDDTFGISLLIFFRPHIAHTDFFTFTHALLFTCSLCLCLCLCLSVSVSLSLYLSVCLSLSHTHMHFHMHTHKHKHAYMCVCVSIYIYLCVCVCVCIYTCMCMYTHIHVCVHFCIHT